MINESPKILLVEEDEVLAEITGFRLELLGYDLAYAHSAEETLDKVKKNTPDLIILDTVLPDMEGLELINCLSSDHDTSRIPILIFSIDADLNAVERAYHAGASDYLVTPYDPAVLEDKIETLLRRRARAK